MDISSRYYLMPTKHRSDEAELVKGGRELMGVDESWLAVRLYMMLSQDDRSILIYLETVERLVICLRRMRRPDKYKIQLSSRTEKIQLKAHPSIVRHLDSLNPLMQTDYSSKSQIYNLHSHQLSSSLKLVQIDRSRPNR